MRVGVEEVEQFGDFRSETVYGESMLDSSSFAMGL